MTSTQTIAPADRPQLALIVLGRDDTDKPHAAAFTHDDAELATKAAGLTGMHAVKVEGDPLAGLAAQLAAGKVFASGRAFVPFVRATLYDQVLAAANIVEPDWDARAATRAANVKPKASATVIKLGEAGGGKTPPASAGQPSAKRPSVASSWDTIALGSLVLAPADGDDTGWWEAVVQEQRGEHMFVLRWYFSPDDPVFIRRRDNLGFLPAGPPPA